MPGIELSAATICECDLLESPPAATAVQCSAVPLLCFVFCAVQYSAVQYSAVQCSALAACILCSAVQTGVNSGVLGGEWPVIADTGPDMLC